MEKKVIVIFCLTIPIFFSRIARCTFRSARYKIRIVRYKFKNERGKNKSVTLLYCDKKMEL